MYRQYYPELSLINIVRYVMPGNVVIVMYINIAIYMYIQYRYSLNPLAFIILLNLIQERFI